MRRAIPVALGCVALLATAAIIGVLAVLSVHIPQASGRASSQVSVAVEAVVFLCVAWLVAAHAVDAVRRLSSRCLGVDQGLALLAIVFAAVAAVATLVQLSKADVDTKETDTLVGSQKASFLMASSVALGVSFALQAVFLLAHFLHSRSPDMALSLHSLDEERKTPVHRVKAVRYSQTTPDPEPLPRLDSLNSQSPSSFRGRSRSGTMTSIRSSLSNAIRPVTSKTQLITRESMRRPASIDLAGRRASTEDSFDSWDTSSVDTQNRQVVMEMSTPPPHPHPHPGTTHGRFLETIPGSPTGSRTPSPNVPSMPFEPPRIRPRSRSYSPSPRRAESPVPQPPPSMSELHIHPLFRSDSPDPPPATTPGTVVMASPNAGQVITHRQSVRSLNQSRVSSNPIFSSPLSHDGNESSLSIREEPDTETDPDTTPSPSERAVTPPIPDWVLGAGSRSSWSGYKGRKSRTESDLDEARRRN